MEKTHGKETVNGKVKLQNLRDFTVQIRHSESGEIVGTGIAISQDGKIVTCYHVAASAGIALPEEIEAAEVGVYFPQARGGETKERRAKIAAHFSESDDDVVVLQLIGKPPPLAPEQFAILSDAEHSQGNKFRSYGYRDLDSFNSGWADGNIMGSVEPPKDADLIVDPIQLDSKQINHGMSGAAVLDAKRNLVVGIVSMTYFADRFGKDRDTAWAVDAKVLTFDPLKIPLYEGEFLELKASEKPSAEVMTQAEASVGRNLSLTAYPAPAPPPEWVGRQDLLTQLNRDWEDKNTQIVGLIGFGGEGKSSLASRWIHNLLEDKKQKQPEGLFWWSFYDRRSVEEFFEAALTYLSGDNEALLQTAKSPKARAHLVAGMLYNGNYLFVLDGLEVMQQQEGDRYGEFISEDLREFLKYFSAPGQGSFCLITSRAPVFDLIEYNSYIHRDVTRLTENEGQELLKKVGVKGPEAELRKAVNLWDGHALTLGLIGSYLAEAHNGDINRLEDIEPPTTEEPRYDRVHRILRRYDEQLSETERIFLQIFSAFRTPVEESAFEKVFRAKTTKNALNAPIAALSDTEFTTLLQRLQTYRILRYSPSPLEKGARGMYKGTTDLSPSKKETGGFYTTHPLIRNHYAALLNQHNRRQTQQVHQQIKEYYLSTAGEVPHHPTLEDLLPLIEAVHHACQAGAYDEAREIQKVRLDQVNQHVVVHQLGAYETQLAIMTEFFPNGDASQEPQVSSPGNKSWILNTVGVCLMNLGRLGEAPPFYEKMIKGYIAEEQFAYAGRGYQNLAELYAQLGRLRESAQAAVEALQLARRAGEKVGERNSLTWQAWAAHLRGDLETADTAFQQAKVLEREIYSAQNIQYLFSLRGIQHADFLRRTDQADYARRVTEANREICERNHWADDFSRSHRVLGDLAADAGDFESAHQHYETALKISRSITRRDVLIEALLAQGRWLARQQPLEGSQPSKGSSQLNEALGYALQGGYRIYEANIRVALSWRQCSAANLPTAKAEAQRALTMSEEMEYYWGKKDAEEVLEELEEK